MIRMDSMNRMNSLATIVKLADALEVFASKSFEVNLSNYTVDRLIQ